MWVWREILFFRSAYQTSKSLATSEEMFIFLHWMCKLPSSTFSVPEISLIGCIIEYQNISDNGPFLILFRSFTWHSSLSNI